MMSTVKTIPQFFSLIQYIEISHLVLERSRKYVEFTSPVKHGSVLIMIWLFISDSTGSSV